MQSVRTDRDLIVLGSGAGGLTAALVAAMEGLRVTVIEHASRIGGTSARSSGTVWIPGNHHLVARGFHDDRDRAQAYLASLVANRGEAAIWQTFLDAGPHMLRDLEHRAGLAFSPFMSAPDYRQDHVGAASGGRALEPPSFDGRALAADFARLAEPLPDLTVLGGMMVTRAEAARLLRADRSLDGLALGLRLVVRHAIDRMRYPRGTRLVMGNALVARLFKACLDRGVEILTGLEVRALAIDADRVIGVEWQGKDGPHRLGAGRGVVLAGGGYPANAAWREAHLPHPAAIHTPAASGCNGSTIELALAAGASLGPPGLDNALWFPSSVASRGDGTSAVWPHIALDRSKPGLIAVDGTGKRFVNEAVSYHEFVRAMYRRHAEAPAIPAWLICDRDFIRRYGLGLVRPRSFSLRRHVESGYLVEARDLATLAGSIGVPASALEDTVARWNGFAVQGRDLDFAKGENAYDRANGDDTHVPNPCIGPVSSAPFYAVAVHPTPLGTSRGLRADASARVLRADGSPIEGLHVCGNDMQSAFGGEYPGAGAQLGQAMTFGWIAARDAAGLDQQSSHTGSAAG